MAIYIAFGANLYNAHFDGRPNDMASRSSSAIQDRFKQAFDWLSERGVGLVAMSGIWRSPAWPAGSDQPDYENGCAQIRTDLSPQALLSLMHECEAQFGRRRSVKNAARTLDLDLLDYNGQLRAGADLQLPHPRMCQRSFVLLPLYEIAPNWHDPINKRAILDWIARLPLSDIEPVHAIRRAGWYKS